MEAAVVGISWFGRQLIISRPQSQSVSHHYKQSAPPLGWIYCAAALLLIYTQTVWMFDQCQSVGSLGGWNKLMKNQLTLLSHASFSDSLLWVRVYKEQLSPYSPLTYVTVMMWKFCWNILMRKWSVCSHRAAGLCELETFPLCSYLWGTDCFTHVHIAHVDCTAKCFCVCVWVAALESILKICHAAWYLTEVYKKVCVCTIEGSQMRSGGCHCHHYGIICVSRFLELPCNCHLICITGWINDVSNGLSFFKESLVAPC